MTERDLYDAALIEINKLEAPSMLLEDYNYFINKAIQQYINKAYNRYEMNQQATDDLRVLKTTVSLPLNKFSTLKSPNEDYYYFAIMPNDYWHMLNCVVELKRTTNSSKECGSKKDSITVVARKMTSDIYPTIISNAYFKPSYKTPYYTLTSISEEEVFVEKTINPASIKNIYTAFDHISAPCDVKDWTGGFVINIKSGDTKKYAPETVVIDYIKAPKKIHLTEEKLEWVYKEGDEENEKNRPETMEFPDYVCYEIINEFVKLLLENASDPRLQTNIPINQSVLPTIPSE